MIVDFRLRPPMGGFLRAVMFASKPRTAEMSRSLGVEPPPSSVRDSVEMLLEEMDRAGVTHGVIPGRAAAAHLGDVSNDEIAAFVRSYPGRFTGFGGIDPTDTERAVADVDRCIGPLGLKGIVLEPGMVGTPMYADDPRIDPIWGKCEREEIPVILMGGGNSGPDISYSSPVAADRVAARFPRLRLILAHGGWPWVQQTLGMAFRRPNVYVSPDMYLVNMPGYQDYVQAANFYLQDRMLFATAYPFVGLEEGVRYFDALPLRPEVREKILYRNAASLLGLS